MDTGDEYAFLNEVITLVLSKKSFEEIMQLREHLKILKLPRVGYFFNQREISDRMNSFKVAAWRRKLLGPNETQPLHPILRRVFIGSWKLDPVEKLRQCLQFYKK